MLEDFAKVKANFDKILSRTVTLRETGLSREGMCHDRHRPMPWSGFAGNRTSQSVMKLPQTVKTCSQTDNRGECNRTVVNASPNCHGSRIVGCSGFV